MYLCIKVTLSDTTVISLIVQKLYIIFYLSYLRSSMYMYLYVHL